MDLAAEGLVYARHGICTVVDIVPVGQVVAVPVWEPAVVVAVGTAPVEIGVFDADEPGSLTGTVRIEPAVDAGTVLVAGGLGGTVVMESGVTGTLAVFGDPPGGTVAVQSWPWGGVDAVVAL